MSDIAQAFKERPDIMVLQEQAVEIAKRLKPAQTKFANLVVGGSTPVDAYMKVREKNPVKRESAVTLSGKWMNHEVIKLYIDKLNEIATAATIAKAQYNEEDWLRTQVDILHKSLGQSKIRKVVIHDGHAYDAEVLEDNLTQANRSQELIAKRFGWLQDNTNVKLNGRTVLDMRRVDLTGAKPDESKRKQAVKDKFEADDDADQIDETV